MLEKYIISILIPKKKDSGCGKPYSIKESNQEK